MEQPVLEIQHIGKSYGPIKALDDFSLSVFAGNILGILGPNGSGKTTTLGILLDIIKPDTGNFLWFGRLADKHQARKKIGALLEQPVFYPYLSAERNLQIVADIKGVSYDHIGEVLDMVDLADRKHSKFNTLSLGMKQRLAVASALIGDPEVLILDEPTNGLDPKNIAMIRNLITEVAGKGVTVLLASHLLDEVQKICTHVAVLNKGRLLHAGSVPEVLNSTLRVEVRGDNMEAVCKAARQMEFVSECIQEKDLIILNLSEEIKASEINRSFVSRGIYLSHITLKKKSLESYFLNLLSD